MDDLKTQARAAIGARDYHAAARLLDKAIGISITSPDVALYDMRAAVREKLEDLPLALADSKQMLQIDPKDARGYLRAGKIYQLQDKDKSALQCYSRGCKMVPTTAPLYKVLRRLYKIVDGRISAAIIRRDPFQTLPLELIHEVLSYLSFPQKLCCLSVSRTWKAILTADSRFYGRLDLISNCRRQPRISVVEGYIKRAKGHLQCLITDVDISTDNMRFHLKCSNELTVLHIPFNRNLMSDLHHAKGLKQLTFPFVMYGLGPHPSFNEVICLIQQFPALTHFKSQTRGAAGADPNATLCNPQISQLRVLDIEIDNVIPVKRLFTWQDKPALINLEVLKLVGIAGYTEAGLLFDKPVQWPTKLRSIKGRFFQRRGSTPVSIPASVREVHLDMFGLWSEEQLLVCQGAKIVKIWRYGGRFDGTAWQDILSQASIFHLLDSSEVQQYRALINLCRNLQELVLDSSYKSDQLTDQDLLTVAKRNPELQKLTLTHEGQISGAGLAKAVNELPRLSELVIDGCGQVDLEVVEWIRGRNIRVRQKLDFKWHR